MNMVPQAPGGGRSAGPTREQIHDAIADALSEHVWAHGTGEIDGDGIGEAADAVVALLSRSAEPPTDGLTVDRYADGLPKVDEFGTVLMTPGVTAEPNEEHGDG